MSIVLVRVVFVNRVLTLEARIYIYDLCLVSIEYFDFKSVLCELVFSMGVNPKTILFGRVRILVGA